MEKIKKWKLQFIIVALGQAISMLENISPEKMGRAFSILTLISSVTMLIGLIFSSSIAEKVGVNIWILHDHAYCFGCNPIYIKSKE